MTDDPIRKKVPRRLSRDESKLLTRRRLLRAATELLAEHGYERLTTGRVAERAGVAQPTFYVHFRDLDQLLETIARELVDELRPSLRAVRAGIRLEGQPLPVARRAYRLALAAITGAQGQLLRLFAAELHRPTPIGQAARELVTEVARDLALDLRASGAAGRASDQDLARIAEAVVVLTVHFGVAHVEGREASLAPLVELLARLTVGLVLDIGGLVAIPMRPPGVTAADRGQRRAGAAAARSASRRSTAGTRG